LSIVLAILAIALWIGLLEILRRAGLRFWRYLAGSCGAFLILMIIVRPLITVPLARLVTALAGIIGKVTGVFQAYFRYGVIFIDSAKGAITVNIDLECSGVIEISAFLSLLFLFSVYNIPERIYIGVIGTLYTIITNALRITVICFVIHFFGTDYYYFAHTLIGRIIFYVLQVVLYFYVFTRPQIKRTKTGGFTYNATGANKAVNEQKAEMAELPEPDKLAVTEEDQV
jgi:exosortase family protein XrtG